MYFVGKIQNGRRIFSNYLIFLCLSLAVLLSLGCSSRPDIPVRDGYFFENKNLTHYKVRPGDTLYSIAWHLNRDYKKIATINGIVEPYAIYPGQTLKLTGNQQKFPMSRHSSSNNSSKTAVKSIESAEKQAKTSSSAKQVAKRESIQWRWPAGGELMSRFSTKGIGSKGLDIRGKQGDPVKAAAKGFVVYRGDALLGYGKIIIIKHDEQFLSAYAHNSQMLVNEGQWVKAGQQIAKIGSSGTDRNKLHFEIRRDGVPVDPLRYLPARK